MFEHESPWEVILDQLGLSKMNKIANFKKS